MNPVIIGNATLYLGDCLEILPTLGKGEYDPVTKSTLPAGLTDEQIADIVAYLQALK